MVDFRVSDTFGSHPKTLGLSHEAIAVWLLGGVWCSRHMTDGYIPPEAMTTITRHRRPIQELIDHNLLVPLGEGWQYVDWLQYQRSREQVTREIELKKARQQRWRQGKDGK